MAIRSRKAVLFICCGSALSTVIFYIVYQKTLSYAFLQRAVLSERAGLFSAKNYPYKSHSLTEKEQSDVIAEEDELSDPMYNDDEDDGLSDTVYNDDEDDDDDYMYDDEDDEFDDDIPGDEEVESLIADYEDDDGHAGTHQQSPGNFNATGEVFVVDSVPRTQMTDDSEWYKSIEMRFSERLQRVKDVCKKYNYPGYHESYTKRKLLYYSSRYDIMVCLCAKVGTSTWKSHLLHMKGITPETHNIHTNYWESKIKAKTILGYHLDKRIKSSTMIMTSRHPLDRLVSAFRDKFCDGKPVDKPQSSGHYKYFWKPALRALHKSRSSDGKLQITFIEFLKFVVKNQSKKSLGERHWGRFYMMCSVCKFRYDYIMKLETYTEDLACLRHKFNITELNVFDRRHAKTDIKSEVSFDSSVNDVSIPSSTSISYFLKVPPDLLSKILKIYEVDFEMFGYIVPTPIRKIVERGFNISGIGEALSGTLIGS